MNELLAVFGIPDLSPAILIVVAVIVVALVIFVFAKLVGRIIVGVATAAILAVLKTKGYI